ncbi:hypothetical protein AB0C96_09795 [Streptomyces sp. NPDC048506]|uniref:hypothetical protein n=1 Tax=Streptomyces sp. NPDC048506 TaxID=3155028 RepID=UPI003413CDF2
MSAGTGKNWTGMGRAEFDEAAPNQLPISTGPVRIPAKPDAYGTAALFGEPTPGPQPRRERPPRPGDADGQDELF